MINLNWKPLIVTTVVAAATVLVASAASPGATGVCGGSEGDYTGAMFKDGKLEFKTGGVVVDDGKRGKWALLKSDHQAMVQWTIFTQPKPPDRPITYRLAGEPWCDGSSTVVKEIRGFANDSSNSLIEPFLITR